jgi:hypothetical protein
MSPDGLNGRAVHGCDLAEEGPMPDQTHEVENVVTWPGLYIASVFLRPNLDENAINVTVTGLPVVEDLRRVFLQVRQRTSDSWFPDQFSTQILELRDDFLAFRIKRLDDDRGWGQRLHVQILLEEIFFEADQPG